MKRRNFLSLLSAASIAPALPAMGAPGAVATAGYNRYMYGLAVFQARTRASVSAADLMAGLRVSAVQADAMLGEMTARGVLSPVTGAVRMAQSAAPRKPYIRKALRQVVNWAEDEANLGEKADAAPRRCTNGVQPVHTSCDPDITTTDTTSGGPKLGVH